MHKHTSHTHTAHIARTIQTTHECLQKYVKHTYNAMCMLKYLPGDLLLSFRGHKHHRCVGGRGILIVIVRCRTISVRRCSRRRRSISSAVAAIVIVAVVAIAVTVVIIVAVRIG